MTCSSALYKLKFYDNHLTTYIHMHTDTRTSACIHTYIHTYIHESLHTLVSLGIHNVGVLQVPHIIFLNYSYMYTCICSY